MLIKRNAQTPDERDEYDDTDGFARKLTVLTGIAWVIATAITVGILGIDPEWAIPVGAIIAAILVWVLTSHLERMGRL